MSDNKLPKFNKLLREAQSASDEVDSFDLDSKNAESKRKWNKLLEASKEANKALIEYIRDNPELLPQILESSKKHQF